jgi:hypothetical protein
MGDGCYWVPAPALFPTREEEYRSPRKLIERGYTLIKRLVREQRKF